MAKNTSKAKKHSRLLVYILVGLAVFSSLIVGTYAKYTMGQQTDGYISSPNFYFTSDLLKETAAQYTLNPGIDGTAEISFEVRNFADDLRISDKKINFTLKVSPSNGVTVKVGESKQSTGSLAVGSTGSAAKITVSGLQNGKTYDISVTGNAGFSTTLKAKVTVRPDDKNVYMHIDDNHAEYVLLTVWNQNISGEAQISFPTGLIPDNSDSAMKGVSNFSEGRYESATFKDAVNFSKSFSTYVYRFFKTPDYSAGEFTVILAGTTATLATPQ